MYYMTKTIKNIMHNYRMLYINTIQYFVIEQFYLLLPIIVVYSYLFETYNIMILFIFLKFKDYISNIPWIQEQLIIVLKDQETISNHWKNDFDLIWVRRSSYFLIIVGLSGILYKQFNLIQNITNVLLNPSLHLQSSIFEVEGLYVYFFIILLGILLDFLGEIHIIFFRNFPVDGKIISTCVKCGKLAVAGAVAVNIAVVPMSYVPGVEPTIVGNKYQQTFGRGYGFTTGRDHLHHFSFENMESVKSGENPMTSFVDKKGMYSVEKANTFLQKPQNLSWAKKNLSLVDCQNLGITKGTIF